MVRTAFGTGLACRRLHCHYRFPPDSDLGKVSWEVVNPSYCVVVVVVAAAATSRDCDLRVPHWET